MWKEIKMKHRSQFFYNLAERLIKKNANMIVINIMIGIRSKVLYPLENRDFNFCRINI